MDTNPLGKALGAGVAAIAVFHTVSALSTPLPEAQASLPTVLAWLALLLTHAAMYRFGAEVRRRVGVRWYVAGQALLVALVGLSGAFVPTGIALYFGLTAQTVVLTGSAWGTVTITLGATLLFAANAFVAWDLYRAATIGLLLAIVGFLAHGIAALVRRREHAVVAVTTPATAAVSRNGDGHVLTPRELEVLRAVVAGGRSGQIASDLRITERTVKAHLASIYQKLDVESRAGAVAAAIQRGLVG